MPSSPDPVSQAKAYQDNLLGALGGDDPAVAQAQTPDRLRALAAEAGADLRARPAPTEWSVLECIGHIWDAEVASSSRYRWIVAHDRPDLPGYDQDAWADRLHVTEAPVEEILAAFEGLREANLGLWRRCSAAERARVGIHRERGPESYDLTFRLIAGHERVHLAQARAALEAVRAATGR